MAGFIFQVPGILLKVRGLQLVFKLMMTKGGKCFVKLRGSAERKEEEKTKTKKMRMMKNQIRLGLLRAVRFSK